MNGSCRIGATIEELRSRFIVTFTATEMFLGRVHRGVAMGNQGCVPADSISAPAEGQLLLLASGPISW